MTITGISSNDPRSLSGSQSGDAMGKDAFMSLLATQLKNQDPLAPTDNSQMIAQLAQFSSLEQMENLNSNLIGLAVLQQGNALLQQLTSSSALIGKDVEYVDPSNPDLKLWGHVESVKIEEGVATLQIDGKSVPLANVVQIGTPPTTSSLNHASGTIESAELLGLDPLSALLENVSH